MKTQPAGIRFLRISLIGIIIVLPFHALFTTWVGSNVGNVLLWRAWKEVLLALLLVVGLWYFLKDSRLRGVIWGRLVNKLIFLYALWHVFNILVTSRDYDAMAQGLSINLRFFLFFVLLQIVLYYKPISRTQLLKIILIPGIGVVVFGLLQLFMLPKDFLTWFGYNKQTTIPPYFTIDEQQDVIRYASTLSGPNTLGAYLAFILSVHVGAWQSLASRVKHMQLSAIAGGLVLATLIVLYASHSRSAWIAGTITIGLYVFLSVPKRWRLGLVGIGVIGIVLLGMAGYQYRDSQFVRDVVLHDDPQQGGEVSSNSGHIEALLSGLEDVQNEPLVGCGVGCAGPASVRHEDGAKIAENYYVQVGQETGLIGAGLFIVIIGAVARELYSKRKDSLTLMMFASLIGLSVANLLLHTWADETLAYIWWGTLAVVLYSQPINKTKNKHELKKQKN